MINNNYYLEHENYHINARSNLISLLPKYIHKNSVLKSAVEDEWTRH